VSKKPGGPAKLAVVIVATATGTHMKSRRPKVLHEIGGKPLLGHVIATAGKVVAAQDILVIAGNSAERIKAAVAASGVGFVEQAEGCGTGTAILDAREAIAGYENVLVLPGDVPLIRAETVREVWESHQKERAAMTALTAASEDSKGSDREIDTGICAFQTAALLAQLAAHSARRELNLSELAGPLAAAGKRVVAVKAASSAEVLGANTLAELAALDATLRAATAARLMERGVTIFRPETCVIDADIEVGTDTVIEPFVQLLGATRVGSDCLIRSYSVIEDCTLGDGVLIRQSCVLEGSVIAHGAQIGPFAHLRPGSEIGEEAHVGNFVETKKAKLGKGVKAGHLTYLGDAEIGEGTNIGAGVITCNYDGVHKHKTKIGKGVFVGSDSTLVAPVAIADGAYVGAGSCITKDIPANALAVARSHQVVKEGWATARRERQTKRE
jgi:bifunctional UDP-N-acetylglucosamine pyrophosphorylase/glucosamine-1-phosphate N-acetyltransferase